MTTDNQLTKEQAQAFHESGIWKTWDAKKIVEFQFFQECLCMPFAVFHAAVEEVLNRPVYTHEFAFDSLRKEVLGEKEPPSMDEIIKLLTVDIGKPTVVVDLGEIGKNAKEI